MNTSKQRFSKPRLLLKSLSLALAVALVSGCSQLEMAQLYFANNGTEAKLEQALPVTLPFREENGWVIVQASVNGAPPVDFVLDTGASMLAILTSRKTAALGLDMQEIKRFGDERSLAAITAAVQKEIDIDFGPISLMQQTVLAIPLESLKCGDDIPEPPFQGVVGHELFHRYVVEINYDDGLVTLHDPATYHYHGRGEIVAADISGRQPFVQAKVKAPDGKRYDARMHVDSGAGIDLSLFPQTSKAIVVPPGGKTDYACFVGGRAKYHTGTSVDIGFGGSHSVSTPASYAIGKEVIDTGQNGRIGSRFLSRHNVVFDYSRGQMMLEPRKPAALSHVRE